MALDRTVKIKKVDNLSVARLAAGMGVSHIGISMADLQKPGMLNKAAGISEWLSGPELVLEVDMETSKEEIEDLLSQLPFDGLDLPIAMATTNFSKPIMFMRHVFKDVAISKELEADYTRALSRKAFLVLETPNEDKLMHLSKELEHYLNKSALMVSAPFNLGSLEHIADAHYGLALELHGTKELKPGVLENGDIAEMLDILDDD